MDTIREAGSGDACSSALTDSGYVHWCRGSQYGTAQLRLTVSARRTLLAAAATGFSESLPVDMACQKLRESQFSGNDAKVRLYIFSV